MDQELVTARRAVEMLRAGGPALPRSQGYRVLAAGVAGAPVGTELGPAYDAGAVRELLGRPLVEEHQLHRLGLPLLAIVRRQIDANAAEDQVLSDLTAGWDLALAQCVGITARVEQTGPIPLVATVAGFVEAGAEITGTFGGSLAGRRWPGERGGRRLLLRPPGAWYERVRGLRLMTGPGRPFTIHDAEPHRGSSVA